MSQERINQQFFNVVAASRIGDAMGTPTEGLTHEEIASRFGWLTTFVGDGTDDSLMATILAETLHETGGNATSDQWAMGIHQHRSEIFDKVDKFFVSVLHLVKKIDAGYRPSTVALGNMPSSSSAMCIWPVALVNAGSPEGAARQAYELARLIHVNDADHCTDGAAALAAAVAAALQPGATVDTAVEAAVGVIRPISGTAFRDTLTEAVALARSATSYQAFRDEYQRRYSTVLVCDAIETVPAAFGLAVLAHGDVKTAVEYGANFGRDADTIASMVGALCGAFSDSLPDEWLESLGFDATASARRVADELLATARSRHAAEAERLKVVGVLLAGH